MSGYQPGYCNIGHQQRRRRLAYAAISFLVTAGGVLARVAGLVPRPLLVTAFIPLSLGFEMVIQAYTSFCVRLALLNRYDFRGNGGDTGRVTDSDARHTDQVYAAKITLVSVALAAVSTGLIVLIVG